MPWRRTLRRRQERVSMHGSLPGSRTILTLQRKEDVCVVCGGSLDHAIDSVTGKHVKTHMHEAALDAALLSQTLRRWAENAQGALMRSLPEALRAETATDLPAHPCDLLRTRLWMSSSHSIRFAASCAI